MLKILNQEEGLLMTDEGNHILVMLCKIAASARVYPKCCVLEDIQYDTQPIAGGSFADVYKGWHRNRVVCIKVP